MIPKRKIIQLPLPELVWGKKTITPNNPSKGTTNELWRSSSLQLTLDDPTGLTSWRFSHNILEFSLLPSPPSLLLHTDSHMRTPHLGHKAVARLTLLGLHHWLLALKHPQLSLQQEPIGPHLPPVTQKSKPPPPSSSRPPGESSMTGFC